MDETAAWDNAANKKPDGPRSRDADRFDVRQHLDGDALSAYLDNALDADERTAVAAHLTACGDCRRELTELGATVALLRGLPQYRPRRSFQLGREYAPLARVGFWERLLPSLPALRAATIAVAVLLIVVSAGDIVSGRLGDDAAFEAAPAAPILADQAPAAVTATGDRALQDMDELDGAPSFADAVTSQAADGFDGAAREAVDEESGGDRAAGAVAEPPPADLLPAPAPAQAAPADSVASGDVASQAESQTTADGRRRPSAWRIAEVALVLVLFWLLVSLVGVQRLRRRT
jgi:hypothetical protein